MVKSEDLAVLKFREDQELQHHLNLPREITAKKDLAVKVALAQPKV
jgi:hypothetical protein